MIKQKLDTKGFFLLKKEGKKIKGRYYIFLYTKSSKKEARFGFIVSKKHGKAVQRNIQKRWIRCFIRAEISSKLSYSKILVIPIPCIATYQQRQEDFSFCLRKLECTLA